MLILGENYYVTIYMGGGLKNQSQKWHFVLTGNVICNIRKQKRSSRLKKEDGFKLRLKAPFRYSSKEISFELAYEIESQEWS